MTDRLLNFLEQLQSALTAIRGEFRDSRSEEKKEKKSRGKKKDRSHRRLRSSSRCCSYIIWKKQSRNRKISPSALRALQKKSSGTDWAKAEQPDLAVHSVSALPNGVHGRFLQGPHQACLG